MITEFDFGDAVRVIRNVKDDGTYPGADVGQLLVRRGSIGHVVDIGTFLQDQIIYSVHFLDINRIVGCREEELIGADQPWVPSRYEFREWVQTALPLGSGAQVLVPEKAVGQIIKVVRDAGDAAAYHVHFECLPGRLLQVPESALLPFVSTGEPVVECVS
jgi:nitrogen fixation protein NifZ